MYAADVFLSKFMFILLSSLHFFLSEILSRGYLKKYIFKL